MSLQLHITGENQQFLFKCMLMFSNMHNSLFFKY